MATTSVASAQSCRNSLSSRYRITYSNRIAYLPSATSPALIRYEFGARQHVDVLATKLYEQSNAICWEMHRGYDGNVDFDATYAAMYKIMQDTKHVYDLVRRDTTYGADRDHIAADLHEMDLLYHHIEDGVSRWVPARSYHYGSTTTGIALSLKMRAFEDTLHNLMDDYGVRSRITGEAPPPRLNGLAPAPAPIAPSNYAPATYPPATYAPSRGAVIPPTQVPAAQLPSAQIPSLRNPPASQPLQLPLPDTNNTSYPPLRVPGF